MICHAYSIEPYFGWMNIHLQVGGGEKYEKSGCVQQWGAPGSLEAVVLNKDKLFNHQICARLMFRQICGYGRYAMYP